MIPFEIMTRIAAVRVGDVLVPDEAWNNSAGQDKLDGGVKVYEIRKSPGSKTGVMFKVKTKRGAEIFVDACWFFHV